MDMTVPQDARERLLLRFGERAGAWCDALPGTVAALARRWSLEPFGQLGGGTSRVVVARGADGSTVYLKLTPDPEVAAHETEALRRWEGCGRTPRVLAADPAAGALLLAGVEAPGGGAAPTLSEAAGPVSLPRVAELLTALRGHAPAPDSALPSLAHRVDFVFGLTRRRLAAAGDPGTSPELSDLVDRCHRAAAGLARGGPSVLVHGDLHAGNVLDAGPDRGLIAIDPRPSVGDPDFDVVDWVLNGVVEDAELHDRIRTLAALVPGLDAERLLAWCQTDAGATAAVRTARGRDDGSTRWMLTLARNALGG